MQVCFDEAVEANKSVGYSSVCFLFCFSPTETHVGYVLHPYQQIEPEDLVLRAQASPLDLGGNHFSLGWASDPAALLVLCCGSLLREWRICLSRPGFRAD